MRDGAINGKDHARAINALRDFRRSNTNDAAMPPFTGNHRHIGIGQLALGALQFCDCQFDYLLLNFFSLLVASVQMLCQTPRLIRVPGAKEFNDCTRCVHSSGRVDPWAKPKPDIVRGHACAIAPGHFHQRTQPGIAGFCQILQTKRHYGSILAA